MEAIGKNNLERNGRTMQNRVINTEIKDALAAYFHDMAAHEVLGADDEIRLAREIEELDVEVWAALLSYAPTTDYVVRLVEKCLDNSLADFKALRAAAASARKSRSKSAQRTLEGAAFAVAPQVRALDQDHRFCDIVMAELHRVAESAKPGKLPFSAKAPAYRRYLGDVERLTRKAQRSRQAFITANLRLVVSVARRFYQGGMGLADLIQEGNLGLMKAVNRFDYRRGFRFSTYATWWIRHTVGRAVANKGSAVRVPVHLSDMVSRVQRIRRELATQLQRDPTLNEVAEAANIKPSRIEEMERQIPKHPVYLDQELGDDSSKSRLDVFRDPQTEERTALDTLCEQSRAELVVDLIASLRPVEADIIRQRFGLGDEERELTLQEIADQYGLSRERIRQIQQEALAKLRKAMTRAERV
jgi:RNA polymerase primary sigma factor